MSPRNQAQAATAVRAIIAVLLCAVGGYAQVSTSVSGTVYDASQAIVPGAAVTLTNTARNTVDTRNANQVGRFLFSNLVPGPYRLEAAAAGFAPKILTNIVLTVDRKLDLNVVLSVGVTEQKIAVSAEAAGLETATPTVGQVVDNRQISNLPLNGRQSLALSALVPNVRMGAGFDPTDFNGAAVFSINGGRTAGAEVSIDGTPAMGGLAGWYGPAYKPSLDTVQEFRVMTNTLPAEFGITDGGSVRIVSKSGTNTLHGSAYDYLRNSKLDANDFFSNRNNIPLGSFRRNQFGGTLGGPVVIPKLYDGRNRTFFFVSYEGMRSATAANVIRTVPTDLQRRGDFSQGRNSAGQPILIYDPITTRANPTGSGYARTPFAGNAIPATRIDPVAQKLLHYWPEPNNPGLPFTGANNLILGSASTYDSDQEDIRIDHRFNDRHSVYGRFSNSRNANEAPRPFGYADPDRIRRVPTRHAVADYAWVKSNATVVNLHFGYSLLGDSGEAYHGGPDFKLQDLGFPAKFASSTPYTGLPQFAITDISTISGGFSFRSPYTIYQSSGSVSHVRGKHTLKTGTDIRQYHYFGITPNQPPASFSFSRNYTQGPDPLRATNNGGIGFASFLLGAGSGSGDIRPLRASQSPVISGYLQDDWKISRKLTVNLGLRYDLFIPGTDPRNEISWFDATARNPLSDLTGLDLRGGLRFAGQDGRRRQFDTDWTNFSPRVGFAYAVTSKLAIRSGFAVLYPLARTASGYTQDGFTSTTSWVSSIDGLTPDAFLKTAFPDGMIRPPGASEGLRTLTGQAITPADSKSVTNYNMQWNFTIQHELPGGGTVEVSYLGNRGVHLPLGEGLQIDQLDPRYLSLGSKLLESVPNPFYGIIGSGTLAGRTTTRAQLLRPFPQFTSVRLDRPTLGDSIYHALGLRFEKRFHNGLIFQASYTNSKLIDNSSVTTTWAGAYQGIQNNYDLRSERSLSSQDVPQNFVMSFQAPLPFGKGQPLLTNAHPVLEAVLGGWQMNGIFTARSGLPLGIGAPNTTNSQGGGQRPNSTGQSAALSGDVHDRLDRYFDTSQFVQPAPFTFGNLARNLPDVRSPSFRSLDFSLFKSFAIREGLRLQFRAEAYNVTNTPIFNGPATTLGSPAFGVISSAAPPRRVQMALRLDF